MLERTHAYLRVAETIERTAAECGALVLRDTLLDLKVRTTQCRFLWIDRYGILALDFQEWPGCRLTGSTTSATWKASAPAARATRLSNPVIAARARRDMLFDALVTCGRRLEPDYVQTLVVFAGADISALRLDAAAQALCVDVGAVDGYLRSRADFEPNLGILETHEVVDLRSLLSAIDRSHDDEAVARHTANTRVSRWSFIPRKKEPTEVGVSDSLMGRAPVAVRVSDRYPTMPLPPVKRRSLLPALLTVLVLLVAAIVAAFVFSGLPTDWRLGIAASPPSAPESQWQTGQPPSVPAAVAALREYAPEVAGKAVAIDAPRVTSSGSATSYTWEYAELDATGAGFKTITLTFDAGGMLVGSSRD